MTDYKYELHFHTSEVSACAGVTAREGVKLYAEKGYTGLVVTDHVFQDWFDYNDSTGKTEYLLQGYRAAKEEGALHNMDIILGMEFCFKNDSNHYLVYGFDEDFFLNNPCLPSVTAESFKKAYSDEGLIICQAHPYRDYMHEVPIKYLDGIEVFNGHPGQDNRNYLAQKYEHLPDFISISGSDFHQKHHCGRGGITTKRRIGNSRELVSLLRSSEYEIIRVS